MSNVDFFVIKIYEADEHGNAVGGVRGDLGRAYADRSELQELLDQDLVGGVAYAANEIGQAVEDALNYETD